ncbi:Myb domain protein 62 [Tanacetum coccineum]
MLHLGTTVTRKETRALGETRKSRLNKGSLVFEVDESFGRIIGKNSKGFITKGGCVMRKFASEDFQKISEKNKKNRSKNLVPPTVGTRSFARRVDESRREGKEVSEIEQYKMAHYSKKLKGMINEEADTIWNDLQAEEATSSCTSAEICLKKLGHLPGHIKGRSASTKQILETVNLRSELKALKEENKATNEKVDYLLEEMKKMAQLLQQFQTRVCQKTGDPNKLMFCKRCDGAYHCYCQHPPHKNVSRGPSTAHLLPTATARFNKHTLILSVSLSREEPEESAGKK